MSAKRDYYEVLGLSKEASPEEIKRAYRKGALKHHPDNVKGEHKAEAEKAFKELAEAYEVLSDSVKRQRYDRYGHEGLRGAGLHDFSSMGFGDIFSMFEDIFGGGMGGFGRGGEPSDRGLDLETEVELTLEQVAAGCDHNLEFDRMDLCDTCGGNGSKPGTQPQKCSTCGGYGQVQQQMQGFFGLGVRVIACPKCRGKGNIVSDPCTDCRGSGRRKKRRLLTVHIPPGVSDGQVVRVRGEGEPNASGTSRGDLHCYIKVRQHPLLARRGEDLICQVPISFSQAALGSTVQVPTLSGAHDLAIPPGTQSSAVFTLKKLGLPTPGRRGHGDLHVQVLVEVPRKLSDAQRDLLEAYAKTEENNLEASNPQRKSFFDKVKDYFATKR